MARRKLEKRHIRNIQKSKGSYIISLPIDLIRKFDWRERQKLEVREYGRNKIIIKDWKE